MMISMILAALWGSLLGFFGVFVSVFSDGAMIERLITIGGILGIYFVSGGIWAYFGSFWSWQWSMLLGIPGILILILYSLKEIPLSPYFLIYSVLILACCSTGTFAGRKLVRMRRD